MGFHSDPSDLVRAEMDERKTFANDAPASRPKRQRPDRGKPARQKQPTAPVGVSSLGQDWYDRGTRAGFEFPYDANYFALALDKKIQADKRFRKLFDRGEDEKVHRWVAKMIQVWWDPVDEDSRGGYLTNDVTPKNAKEMFLVEDWDDCQEYARTALRVAYLKEHGRRVPPPEYPQAQEYQRMLKQISTDHQVRRYVESVDLDTEPPQLDEGGRERLRSWRDRRKGRK